jgi:glycosyltransferase involved in cell wall biosynthesis
MPMTSTPAISILTPVWNGLPYIKETVASVLSQDFQDWELLIADNDSTDGTREFIKTLTDPRIHVFLHEKNLGVYKNIRFLFSKAKAPIGLGLGADDYLHPGGLAKVVAEWKKVGPDTAFISFNWKKRMNHSKLAKYSYDALSKKLDTLDSRFAFFLFGNIPGNLTDVSVKIDLFNSADDFIGHMKYAGDFEFWSRISKNHTVILCDENVSFVRRHDRVASKYMFTKGEGFTERQAVYERLIDELSPHYDRKKLIAYYNLNTRSFQLRDALVAILKGRLANFINFMRSDSPILWPKWIQLIVCFPFALCEKCRLQLSVNMARKIMKARRRGK